MDVASSIQQVTEEIMTKICKSLKDEYKIPNLCLAGGVALNCVANGKILKEKIFDKIWIQPAAGDAGGSLGAALAYWHHELKESRKSYNWRSWSYITVNPQKVGDWQVVIEDQDGMRYDSLSFVINDYNI